MIEDTELLRRYVAERSNPAFAELVCRHVDLVYATALRTVGGDAHAAQDVAQTVFIALARQAGGLLQHRALAGWLYLAAHHTAAQRVRTDRRRQTREHQAHAMNEILNPPEIEWQRVRPVLDDAMRELSEVDREAVLLRFFEQRPFAEIGAALRVTEDAARVRVDRALDKLRGLLARRGVSSTAAALAGGLGQQAMAAPAGLAIRISNAIATKTASSAAAITTTTFVNPTTLVAGALALAVIGTTLVQSNHARNDARELAAARPQPAESPARVDDVGTGLAQNAQRETAALPIATHRRDMSAGQVNDGGASTVEESLGVREPDSMNPERTAWRERMVASYEALARKLALSAPQTAALQALVRENLLRHDDLRSVARAQGLKPGDPDVAALAGQADAELARRIQADFGATAYDAFRHFNELAPVREFVGHIAGELTHTSEPLRPEQAGFLIEIMDRNRMRGPDGSPSGDPRALDIDAVIAQARVALSAPQLAAVRRVYESRN